MPLYINLYARKSEGLSRLKGYISIGGNSKKKHFTTDIVAPYSELCKFNCRGSLFGRGIKEPPLRRLQEDIKRLYKAAQEIAQEAFSSGVYESITSKELYSRIRNLYYKKMAEDERG